VNALLSLSRAIDAINERIGKAASWLILAAILVSTANAIIRYIRPQLSSNAWLELQWYLFGATFLLVAPWTLKVGEHIRIDILNAKFSPLYRNWIDLLGHLLFLLPVCAVMFYYSVPMAKQSFLYHEVSQNAGGLPVWPAKFLIPLGFAILFFQGVSEAIKRIAVMKGLLEDHGGGGHHAAAEAEAQRLLETAQELGLKPTDGAPSRS
jgi:TRAP-type mannitol/chloroaromatic compound transport system permease small subunit